MKSNVVVDKDVSVLVAMKTEEIRKTKIASGKAQMVTIFLGDIADKTLADGAVLLDGDIIQEDVSLNLANVACLAISEQIQEGRLACKGNYYLRGMIME